MKKVLIDLNILLDLLNKRMDHESALIVFDKCVKTEIKGFICSDEITTLSYFLEKENYKKIKRNKVINRILDTFSILSANEKTLRLALESEIEDYEDAVIDELAYDEQIDFIISRNLKDFKKSKNNVCTAKEAINIIEMEENDTA